MKAVVTQENKTAAVEEKAIPVPEHDEVLVKVFAVALNPTDWKHLAFISPPGVISGCDLAGVVEKVGANVTNVKVGDQVGALVHGSRFAHTGAFAEYSIATAHTLYKKPDHLDFEETATCGAGFLTAAASLYQKLGLPKPSHPSTTPVSLLVWSGATSVGQFAIQLGKLSGLTVVTTASPKNHEYLKSLGADHVFDYKDSEVVNKIKAVAPDLAYALDCISEGDSQTLTANALGPKGGKVVTLLGTPKDTRADVQFVNELLYTATGRPFELMGRKFAASPEDKQFIADFIVQEMNPLLSSKKVKPNQLKRMPGGLAAIPDGMEYMKAGKVSAEKLTYVI